jgi:hypothetical protein
VGLPLLLLDWLKPAWRVSSARILAPTLEDALSASGCTSADATPSYPQDASIADRSLAAAFGLTTVRYTLKQWRAAGWRLPAWGQKLLAVYPQCVASADVQPDAAGTLASVGQWYEKLQAIHDAIRASWSISRVICATADKATVGQHWQAITQAPLAWQPDAGSGCWQAHTQIEDHSVTFWACPTLRALLATFDPGTFDPHQQRRRTWRAVGDAVLQAMVLSGLGALPFFQPYCPRPDLRVFSAQKLYHVVEGDPRPWVKLAPEEASIPLSLQVWECGTAPETWWSAQATAAVFQVQSGVKEPLRQVLPLRPLSCARPPADSPGELASSPGLALVPPQGEPVAVTVRAHSSLQPVVGCPDTSAAFTFMLHREAN